MSPVELVEAVILAKKHGITPKKLHAYFPQILCDDGGEFDEELQPVSGVMLAAAQDDDEWEYFRRRKNPPRIGY